jgi:CRISPR-associated endonuclease/helicase Cas3
VNNGKSVDVRDILRRALVLPANGEPFPWQQSLLDRFLDEGRELPTGLDVPTGLGKTSVMAIWLVAKACGAVLPRRLIYVVDRRVVVDQATAVAEGLRQFVENSSDVKRQLGLPTPLPISTLRGQHIDNREWAQNPASPAIIIGTVDMIGSRLLFEGYGISRKMRPYHAGLLGSDSLLVLDEAHLVPPFEALLESITNSSRVFAPENGAIPIIPHLRLMTLSATGKQKANLVGLTPADLNEGTETHRRLTAKKRLTFHTHNTEGDFIEWMAAKAWELRNQNDQPQRVLIFCNRRKDAEQVYAGIGKTAKAGNVLIECELLVGGRRVLERQRAASCLESHGWFAGALVRPEKPTFLIATSAGEVGVDLDADHLVCDLVEWERMVQRLGRVNRRGHGDAKVLVLLEKEREPNSKEKAALAKSPSERDDKEVKLVEKFQEKSARPRRLRQPFDLLPQAEAGTDVSPLALRKLRVETEVNETATEEEQAEAARKATFLANASSPTPLRPALTRPLVDAWSMTSLREHTGRPKIEPWLRGWVEEDRPQTQVAWRTHLPVHLNGKAQEALSSKDVSRYFEAAPVHVSEILETEADRVLSWIEARAKSLLKMKADEQVLSSDDTIGFLLDASGEVEDNPLRLGDFVFESGDKRAKDNLKRRLAHHLLVLNARVGGLRENGLLDQSITTAVHTADEGQDWMPFKEGSPIIRFKILREKTSDPQWLPNARLPLNEDEGTPATEWLFIYKWKGSGGGEDDRSVSDPQELAIHQQSAERCMRRMADALQLPTDLSRALCLAALIHDEGKDCDRWQDAFNAPREGRPYAKTEGPISQAKLGGFRHELLSMIRARENDAWKTLPSDLQGLVLHLIAAHHGFARPLIGIESCDDFPPSLLGDEAVGIALRFAKLQKQWGPWGLAWLESILRAADQQASRAAATLENKPEGKSHE